MGIIAIHCDSNMEHKVTPCRQHADILNVTKGLFTQITTVFYKVNANLAANTNRGCNKPTAYLRYTSSFICRNKTGNVRIT